MPHHGPVVSMQQAQCFAHIIEFEATFLNTPKLPLTALVAATARELLREALLHRMPEMVLDRLKIAVSQADYDVTLPMTQQGQW